MSLPAVTIRDLELTDAMSAARLTPGWTFPDYVSISRGDFPDRICLIATSNSDVKGLILVSAVPPDAEILNVFVAEDARNHGMGRMLLDAAILRVKGRGARKIWLEVRESNAAARRLYESSGFRETGRRTLYYKNPDEDALLLETTLTNVLASAL